MSAPLIVTPSLSEEHLDLRNCDRCGALGKVHVQMMSGDLVFCQHHGDAYAAKLRESALLVSDATHSNFWKKDKPSG